MTRLTFHVINKYNFVKSFEDKMNKVIRKNEMLHYRLVDRSGLISPLQT